MENQNNINTNRNRTQNEEKITEETKLLREKYLINTVDSERVEQEDDGDGIGALFWLLFCSTLMFTLPFGVFFYIKDYITNHYVMDKFQTNCYSVLGAVVTVNLIICLYVYKGFQEFDNMKKVKK